MVNLSDTERAALQAEYVRLLMQLASRADPLAAPGYITRIDRILGVTPNGQAPSARPEPVEGRRPAPPATPTAQALPITASGFTPSFERPKPEPAERRKYPSPIFSNIETFLRLKTEATVEEILDHLLAAGLYADIPRDIARTRTLYVLRSKDQLHSVRRGVWALK